MFNLVFGLGGQELMVIGLIILVFFGGKKITLKFTLELDHEQFFRNHK